MWISPLGMSSSGVDDEEWNLIQLPPEGHWGQRARQPRFQRGLDMHQKTNSNRDVENGEVGEFAMADGRGRWDGGGKS